MKVLRDIWEVAAAIASVWVTVYVLHRVGVFHWTVFPILITEIAVLVLLNCRWLSRLGGK